LPRTAVKQAAAGERAVYHPGTLTAAATVEPPESPLMRFDRIRALLVLTGLPPAPDVYDLLWRHLDGDDFALSTAIDAAIVEGKLDMAAIAALRSVHCGGVAVGELSALVAAAHEQAVRITARLADGRTDLTEYGRTIADGDAALNGGGSALSPAALAVLIDRLGTATGAMLLANQRMQTEIDAASEEAKGLRDRLRHAELAAVTDPLTGLLNRRGVFELLDRVRAVSTVPLSVAMVDIDFFKRVNDRWGHGIGDEVLRYVALHLSDGLARSCGGTAGRMGGEEFIALLPGTPQSVAVATIDALRASLVGQLLRRNDDGVSIGRVSFSAGVAADRPGDPADVVIARADDALYSAKRLGRDRVIPDRAPD